MVSFNGPIHTPDPERSDDGKHSSLSPVQASFRALVHSLDSKTEVINEASHFISVAISAIECGHAPPELLLHCMKLRNPQSGENLFVELGWFPGLVASVCSSISETVQRGKPISSEALRGLCYLASKPHMSGVHGSLLSYQTLVRGLTNFYQLLKDDENEEQIMTPASVMSDLFTSLHRTSRYHPLLVAEVIQSVGSIPLSPGLVGHLDSLLWNTAHPSRATVAPEVRSAAVHAIADRILRPPVLLYCDDDVGTIDTRRAVELFVSLMRQCEHAEVVIAALDRLPDILRKEANEMMSSWNALKRSSFSEGRSSVPLSPQMLELLPIVEHLVERGLCAPSRVQELGRIIKQADRIDCGLRILRVAELNTKLLSFVPGAIIQRFLLTSLRLVDRVYCGAVKQVPLR